MQPTSLLHRAIRRLQLTTKQVNGGYYKGTRSGAMGRHTKHGQYIIDWDKVRTYVVPDLAGFQVCSSLLPFPSSPLPPSLPSRRVDGVGTDSLRGGWGMVS